ncbi:MAG: NAD(+)--rifampin ADP-ribosyltransferase [Polyangiaceae bacterium]
MPFDPNNDIVKRCLRAIAVETTDATEAQRIARDARDAATDDFERFLAAYHVARFEKDHAERIRWLETALACATRSGDLSARTALGVLHVKLAEAHEECGHGEQAAQQRALAEEVAHFAERDPGPFFHGTRADLRESELLTPGLRSNYQADLVMNHVYFTALVNGAGLAASLAKGEGRERVYLVEPAGSFEDDPNVTNKRFPGNLTRSYRSSAPLKVLGEVIDWAKRSPEDIREWKDRLARSNGEIIN